MTAEELVNAHVVEVVDEGHAQKWAINPLDCWISIAAGWWMLK